MNGCTLWTDTQHFLSEDTFVRKCFTGSTLHRVALVELEYPIHISP